MNLQIMTDKDFDSLCKAIDAERDRRLEIEQQKVLINQIKDEVLDLGEIYPTSVIEIECKKGVCTMRIRPMEAWE